MGNNRESVVSMKDIAKDYGYMGVGASQGNPCDATSQTNDGLLVPFYRIIAKNVKFIDLDDIDRHHKRTNQKAFTYFIEDVIKKSFNDLVVDCFKEYFSNNEEATLIFDMLYDSEKLTIDILKDFGFLSHPPIEVVNNINSKLIGVKNRALINCSKSMFRFYIDFINKEYRGILISNSNTINGDVQKSILMLDTRYSQCYRRKVEKRMKWLCYKYGNSKAVLLTLTMDPGLYNYDKFGMWMDIKNQYHRFITALKYHFKKSGRVFPRYICSIESQGNGNPHLHIVFLGASRLIDWRRIKDIWHQGFIYINRTGDNQKIRYPINYVTKYITKTFCRTNDKNLLTQSLSWLFNIRSFSCSRGLVIPLKPKSSGEWRADGLIIVDKGFDIDFLCSNIDLVYRFMNPLDLILKWI